MLALLVSRSAWAISGPYVIGAGQLNVYVGVDAQRLERLQIQDEAGRDAEVIDVGEGLSTIRGKAIATLGMANRFDLEIDVPYEQTRANRPDSPLCDALGLDACKTSTGFGVIAARVKWLAIDEYAGAPVSLAVILEGRIGALTHASRARITNRGEGTQDFGGQLALGRVGGLHQGYWAASTTLGWRYRLPNTRTYPAFTGDTSAPNSEFVGGLGINLAPWSYLGFGPVVDALWRPGGLDFKQLDLTDPDRLAALRIANVRVGGSVQIHGDRRDISGSLTVTHTAYAMNNPYVTTVSAGISVQRPLWKRQ